MTKSKLTHIALTLIFSLLLVSCSQAAPILVYVTPTVIPQVGPIDQPPSTAVPTIGQQSAATATPPASIDSAPTAIPTAIPDVTFVGAVIGPDYTLPPTSTQRPTVTPTEGPSETPAPTSEGATSTPPPNILPPASDTPGPSASGTQLPTLDTSRMGIQIDPNLTNADWQNAVAGNVKDRLNMQWIKVQLSWEALQPDGPNDFGEPFQLVEQHLQFAYNNGFKILVSVAKAPHWARSNQNEDGPPDDPQTLATFLNFFVTKFPFINAIEIWNEPNLQREWQGTLPFSGAGYMQLFGPAYRAIRSVSQSVVVVTAGLAPTGDSTGASRDDRAFLREMYANGLAQYGDVAVGVHPYSWANGPDATCCGTRGWDDNRRFFFHDTMEDYRQIMQSGGQGNNQLWPTEFGWATWDSLPGEPPDPWMAWNDKWAQANYTIRAFQIGQTTANIGPMFLWNLNFAMLGDLVQQRDERAAYSLLVPLNPSERPLFWMIYDAVRPDVQLPKYD